MEKKQMLKVILLSVICSVIVSVLIFFLIANSSELSIADFNVSKLNYTTETPYSDTVYYNGTATIDCKDKEGTYLLIYSEKLVSGGTYEKIGKTNYYTCIVHNGKGEITTFDVRRR